MKQIYFIFFIGLITSCNKSDFLNTQPNPSLIVPATIADYQAILDNDEKMNGEGGYGLVPALGEAGSDNYYLSIENYSALSPLYQRVYTWQKDVFENEQVDDWNIPYQSINYANIVLDGLANLNVSDSERDTYDRAKGSALFYRAHLFYQLAQIFALPFNGAEENTEPGIPLRLTSSLQEPVYRASIDSCYKQILHDLQQAVVMLPISSSFATQPNKASCYGLLAKINLTMQNYEEAYKYADSCLSLKSSLIDYNIVDVNNEYPFTALNDEVLFQCEMINGPNQVPVVPYIGYVDSNLVKTFDDNDLRKQLYFKSTGTDFYFTGSYSDPYILFAGIATDEIYLIRAECAAKTNRVDEAFSDVNTVLLHRYITGTYSMHTSANTPDLQDFILQERRKELCFRGARWTDLRRLNLEGKNIRISKNLSGVNYYLDANDKRYIYPIPQPVISFNPGMQQNER